jgi:hypothetical protein
MLSSLGEGVIYSIVYVVYVSMRCVSIKEWPELQVSLQNLEVNGNGFFRQY